jgi:Mono-functional DNA-alkylating methyl methanesulfonate N-term/CPSF A subunit region
MPLLMIPSSHNDSFTLVTESGLTVYDDVLSTPRQIHIEISQSFPPTFAGSCRSPLWVQWAKPCRHSMYCETNDDFYLIREDGEIEYFEIQHNTPTKLSSRFTAGYMKMGVDSAFAILGAPRDQGGDVFFIGGDTTDGAVCHLRARKSLEQFQTIMNLAPTRDMIVVEPPEQDECTNRFGAVGDSRRIFVCSGKTEDHAAVAEIRRGLEAKIGFFAELDEPSTATRIWVLPGAVGNQIFFLISYPSHTTALKFDFNKSTLKLADDALMRQGFDLSSQTLAVSIVEGGRIFQITSSRVLVLSPLSASSSSGSRLAEAEILLANIDVVNQVYATVIMATGRFHIQVRSIDANKGVTSLDGDANIRSMVEEPSSILIATINGRQCLVIGTNLGRLDILAIGLNHELELISQIELESFFPEIGASAICGLAFLTHPAVGTSNLACGTRSGWLCLLTVVTALSQSQGLPTDHNFDVEDQMSARPDLLTLQRDGARRIGKTSVNLVSDSENGSATLAFCDSEIHRITYLQSAWAAGLQVSKIWFTDIAQVSKVPAATLCVLTLFQPELEQPAISAVATLSSLVSSGMNELEATLVCASTGQIVISSLSLESSIVPRKIMVAGDPYKLVFVENLSRLVVAIDQIKLVADSIPRRPARRVIRPGIQFLDPDQVSSKPVEKPILLLGEAGSRITSLLSWTPIDGRRHLNMIVVGLWIESTETERRDGRLIYLTAGRSIQKTDHLDVDVVHSKKYKGSPIYAVAAYDSSSLVVCADKDLFLQTLNFSTNQLVRGASHTLPTPAISIHVHGRSIYATTAQHSLMVFEVEGDSLILRANDTKERRATQFIGTDEGGMLATSSNKGGRVLGLSKHGQADISLLFDASLPVTVNCLREAKSTSSPTKSRKEYYGSSFDATLYQFSILNRPEWELLDYVAQLAWKKPTSRGSLKRKISGPHRKDRKKTRPIDMHINGDRVVDLLRTGPAELQQLLDEAPLRRTLVDDSLPPEERVRKLAALGRPLFGDTDNPVMAACQWMQKLVSDQ